METLPHPRYELYATFLANGKPILKAYVLAGYKDSPSAMQASSKLLKVHPEILARATTLRNERAEDLRNANIIPMNALIEEENHTQAMLIKRFDEIYHAAFKDKNYSAAIHANHQMGVYLGYDRPMVRTISANMTDQELVEDVNAMINKMGGKPILLIESDNKES